MWNVEAWEKMQHSFPDNNNSIRIVVTTRLSNLASRLNNIYCLKMKFLDEGSSWDLLSKHVFGEESRPLELEQIGKDIVENCRGLPLSIVVLGGLLKKMERTNQCWESVRKNSSSLVNSENEDFCLKILKMSYNHLPVHLKPCFLYMGVFEIDRVVRVSTLVKLWVSEGFLKPISGKSLEMVAKEYLNDLVDRNLILVHELGSTGNIKFCKLHDLLRDLCWREAAKEGFYNVVGPHNFGGLNRQRRVVIPGSTSKEDAHDTLLSVPLLLARSFICDSSTEVLPLPESRLLRAFKAYDRDRSGSHDYMLDDVFRFVNLSYIAVGVHHESNFLPSLNLLWNLHTLVIFNSVGFSAPKEIWKMPQLRHVEFLKGDMRFPAPTRESGSWKRNFVVMKNLQTLKGVSQLTYPASTIIPNIKKLGVTDGSLLRSHNMTKLESYRCWGIRYVVECDFPRSLKKLSLGSNTSHFALDEDMLENIGTLPFLEKLKLTRARFQPELWETSEDRFLSLKFLEMNCCLLVSWITESSHFPRLEKLRLFGMNELKEIPLDIGDIPTLESIHLEYCSETAVVSAKNIAKEQEEVRVRVVLFNNIYNKYLRSLSSPNFLVEFVDF